MIQQRRQISTRKAIGHLRAWRALVSIWSILRQDGCWARRKIKTLRILTSNRRYLTQITSVHPGSTYAFQKEKPRSAQGRSRGKDFCDNTYARFECASYSLAYLRG